MIKNDPYVIFISFIFDLKRSIKIAKFLIFKLIFKNEKSAESLHVFHLKILDLKNIRLGKQISSNPAVTYAAAEHQGCLF